MSRGFLLDTNIPSEQIRVRPDPAVGLWLYAQPEESLFLSAISVGELQRGISLLPAGKRRSDLELWFDGGLIPRFLNRVIPVSPAIARTWGRLAAKRRMAGRPLGMADGLIAATALEHGLDVVTRNVDDFAGMDLSLINPWT